MAAIGDPFMVISNLAHPGGNITGATQLNVEVTGKRLELVRQLFPSATAVGVLVNPASPNADPLLQNLEPAAASLGLELKVLHASNETELAAAFTSIDQQQLKALLIGTDPFFSGQAARLADLALRHAVATIFQYPEFTAAGGLISFGGIIRE